MHSSKKGKLMKKSKHRTCQILESDLWPCLRISYITLSIMARAFYRNAHNICNDNICHPHKNIQDNCTVKEQRFMGVSWVRQPHRSRSILALSSTFANTQLIVNTLAQELCLYCIFIEYHCQNMHRRVFANENVGWYMWINYPIKERGDILCSP